MLVDLSAKDQEILYQAAVWYKQKLLNDIQSIDKVIMMLKQQQSESISIEHLTYSKWLRIDLTLDKIKKILGEDNLPKTSGEIAVILLKDIPANGEKEWVRINKCRRKIAKFVKQNKQSFVITGTGPRNTKYRLVKETISVA